mgnify:CR=1 FL=1
MAVIPNLIIGEEGSPGTAGFKFLLYLSPHG